MAYSMAAPLYIGCYIVWDNPDDGEVNERWHDETLESLEPITHGHYMVETDLTASPTRARDSLAPGGWERVQEIQQRYDPQGIFYGHIGQA
jgi:FAD/FMN-containing dehydrogenase